VPYGRVVQVIGLAQAAGLSRIGFVADPIETPAAAADSLPAERRRRA
jgi:biopolymer transport protein TolR